jgi:transmembrane sensor
MKLTWLAAIAASILVAVGAWGHFLRDVYDTEVGEQRTLALSDGSRVELNALSKVRIRYTDSTRLIELLSGQAFFRVARDESRPLVVVTADTRIRAIGTQFDVYRKQSGTTVAVIEGKVSVDAPRLRAARTSNPSDTPALAAHEKALMLIAGEQVTVNPRTAPRIESANPGTVTAWTQGRLVFQGTALKDVAEEFNRYNKKPLVISDPGLAAFRITGIFSSTDPSSLIRFLEARSDVSVTEGSDEISVHR